MKMATKLEVLVKTQTICMITVISLSGGSFQFDIQRLQICTKNCRLALPNNESCTELLLLCRVVKQRSH